MSMRRWMWLCLICLLLAAPVAAGGEGLLCENTEAFYTYADLLADAATLEELGLPVEIIGHSVGGQPLLAFTLGTGEAYALVLGGVHGNETANTPMLMRAVAELYRRLQANEEAFCDLVNQCTLIVAPCVNPDGYIRSMGYVTRGRNYYEKGNANQVNLNRNFPTPYWGNAKGDSQRDYAGPSAASEPETQAVAALMERHPYSAMVDVHSKGRQTYYGKGGFGQEDVAIGYPVEALDEMTHTLAQAVLPEKYRLRKQAAASKKGGFGSSTDYAFHLGYPGITLETIPMSEKGPITPKLIDREYELLALPELLMRLCEAVVGFAGELHPAE